MAKNPLIPKVERAAYAGGDFVLREDELNAPARLREPAIIGTLLMGDLFHESINFGWQLKILIKTQREVNQKNKFMFLTKRPLRAYDFFSQVNAPNNCWPGVSVEDQPTADKRVRDLLCIQAAHLWISAEPLLGPVDLLISTFNGPESFSRMGGISLVVAGPETGPGARPCKPEWIADLRKQCRQAGVAFVDKRWPKEKAMRIMRGLKT